MLGMPFLETIEGTDLLPLSAMHRILDNGRVDLDDILTDPSLIGGINDKAPLQPVLVRIKRNAQELSEKIATMPWVADGISEEERPGAETIQEIAFKSFPVLWVLMDKPWVWDGLDDNETSVVRLLAEIASSNTPALRFMRMPFLDTVEVADVMGLKTLNRLHASQGVLNSLLDHPDLAMGVTDESIPLITALYTIGFALPESGAKLMSSGIGIKAG